MERNSYYHPCFGRYLLGEIGWVNVPCVEISENSLLSWMPYMPELLKKKAELLHLLRDIAIEP